LKKEKDRRGLCLDVVDTYAFDAITNMALGYHHFLYQGISKSPQMAIFISTNTILSQDYSVKKN